MLSFGAWLLLGLPSANEVCNADIVFMWFGVAYVMFWLASNQAYDADDRTQGKVVLLRRNCIVTEKGIRVC